MQNGSVLKKASEPRLVEYVGCHQLDLGEGLILATN